MNYLHMGVLLAASATAVCAQAQDTDTTDVFYRHLNLKEVVVVGATGETALKEATTPVTLLSARELQMTAASNIVDAVAHVPGVAQITTGSGISKPVIRGLGYNRVLVVADGVRQEGQQWGDEHGIEIDAATVNSVEVLKGPASLVYGSDALAGVVRFNTAPTIPLGRMRLNLSTEYQTNNGLIDYSVNWAGNKNGNVWDMRYSEKHAHAYKAPEDGYVPGTQFSERAARVMGGINRSWGHSHLLWSCYHLTPSIAEGERDEITGALEHPEGIGLKSYHHGIPYQQVKHYKVVWDNAFYLGGGTLKATLGYQMNRRQEFEEEDDPNECGLHMKLYTLTYNAHFQRTDGVWQWTAGAGGMWQKNVNAGEEYLIPDYRLLDAGVFATATRKFERWTLSGGVRYDHRHVTADALEDDGELRFEHFTRNMGGITGSVGAVYHACEHLDLRANVSSGFRAPGISELASNGEHEGALRYELGNNDLKCERSLQFDLGLDYADRNWSASLALFANRVNNYIFLHRLPDVVIDSHPAYQYTAGTAQLMGGEVSVDVHPLHSVHLGTSLDIVNAVQLHRPHESRYLPFTPAPRWCGDVKWEILHDGRHVNNAFVAMNVAHHFRQNHYLMEGDTETATPAYTLLSFTAGCDIMHGERRVMSVYLMADNVTNKAYQNHLSRLKYAPENPITGLTGVNNPGRNFTVKLVVPLEW